MNLILLFFSYAFVGWVWECIYESVRNRKLINRGFLNGPIIPIYGFGGLFAYIALQQFGNNTIASYNSITIFFIGMIGATIIEYATAIILESIFNTTWWDYTDYPLNYKGRICAIASLFWGIVAVTCIQYINPKLITYIDVIPHDLKLILSSCFITTMVLDTYNTIAELIHFKDKLKAITDYGINKIDSIHTIFSPTISRLIHAFPKFKFKSLPIQNTYLKMKENWKLRKTTKQEIKD